MVFRLGASAISVSRWARKEEGKPVNLAIAERFGRLRSITIRFSRTLPGADGACVRVGERPPIDHQVSA
jgi:hypothetical protein